MTRFRVLCLSIALTAFACAEPADPPAPTVPGAPTDITVTFGDATVTVRWKAPASDGGSPLTGYTVVSAPGDATAKVDAQTLSAQVTGLTNGASYTFQVFATNAMGDGPLSLAAAPVAPGTVPSAPTAVSVVRGNAQVTVTWQAPASDGGSDLTGYTITASPGTASVSAPGYATSAVITGLDNGSAYTFVVVAKNEHGDSAASAPSDAVTPATVPDAVSEVVAHFGNAQATVTWQAPADDGGSVLAGYRVTPLPAGTAITVDADTLTATVVDLPNGVSIAFEVVAFNEVGDSQPATSNPVVPATVPSAPGSVEAIRGDGQVTLNWTAPASDGGRVVTGYVVTGSPGDVSFTTETLSATVDGLPNGIAYVFSIAATNAVGTGTAIDTQAVTPAAVPDAPGFVSAVAGDASVLVTWQAPEDNGSKLGAYVVTSTPAGFGAIIDADSLSAAIDGLTNGAAYVFHVAAINEVGAGPEGSSTTVTPLGPPDASKSTLTASSRSATADGKSAITLTVAVRDAQGNVLTGVDVSFEAASEALTLSATHGATDAQGMFATDVTAARWGTFRLTATSGDIERHIDLEFTLPVCEGQPLKVANPEIPLLVDGTPIATGDLDGDGVGDVVVLGDGTPKIAVVLGASPDGYRQQTVHYFKRTAHSVAVFDFDGDGRQDVVLGLVGPDNELAVLDGRGNGNLAPARYVTVPVAPVAVARLPGTQALLVVDGVALSVLTPDDDGGFVTTTYPSSSNPTLLTVVDVDSDGHHDVLVTAPGLPATIFYGHGDGTFENGSDFPSGSATRQVAFGDFNGDGKVDVAWTTYDLELRLSLNEGDRNFGVISKITLPHTLEFVVAYDVDGDGVDELAVGSQAATQVSRLKATDGVFLDEDVETVELGVGPRALMTQPLGDRQAVLVNLFQSFTFPLDRPAPILSDFLVFTDTAIPVAGDLDGDGLPDLLSINPGLDTMTVRLGQGRTLSDAVSYADAGPAISATIEDMNGDGWADVVVARIADLDSSVDIWLNQGDGTLARASQTPSCRNPYDLRVGDLDADGHPDVVVSCVGDLVTSQFTDSALMSLLGDGEGNLEPLPSVAAGIGNAGLALGDFNGDGHLDVTATGLYTHTLALLLGDGTGELTLSNVSFPGLMPFGMDAGDIDGDGILDLAVGMPMTGMVKVLRGHGDGTFEEYASSVQMGASRVRIVDFDRDGLQDVVVGSYNTAVIHVWRGIGHEQSSVGSYKTGAAGFIEVADFDQDGLLDVLVGGTGIYFQASCE